MSFRVIVTGGREYANEILVYATLSRILVKHPDLLVVHGDCKTGADAHARTWCEFHDVPHEPHPADWNKYGKRGGPIRNSEMVNKGADGCVSFPGNNGTHDCTTKARLAGIPVMMVKDSH